VQRLIMARMAEQGSCPRCQSSRNGLVRHRVWRAALALQRLRQDLHRHHRHLCFTACATRASCWRTPLAWPCGLSVRKTAARLGLSVQKTFRWRHRFLDFLNQQKPSALAGMVEVDETFFPVSYKGQRKSMPRTPKKRGGKAKDGSGTDKTAVVVAVQRGTQVVFDQVLEQATGAALTEALRPVLGADAVLSTDGNAAGRTVAEQLKLDSGCRAAPRQGRHRPLACAERQPLRLQPEVLDDTLVKVWPPSIWRTTWAGAGCWIASKTRSHPSNSCFMRYELRISEGVHGLCELSPGQSNRDASGVHSVACHLTPARWPNHFFPRASCKMSAFRRSSAYIFLSLAFSTSSSFMRAISDTSNRPLKNSPHPPQLCYHMHHGSVHL